MTAVGPTSPWYPRFKAVVFALLACNTAYYLFGGAWTEALDALAWLTLLALFALETGFDGAFGGVGALKLRPTAAPCNRAKRDRQGRGFIAPSRMIASVVRRLRARNAMTAIRGLRLAAAAGVGAAAIGYAYQNEWLDAVNTALWIAVVVLLEFEVRNPGAVARQSARFTATAVTLYAGLGALVLVWAWRGAWFDAYDAALWLTAFAMIEMDVLRAPRREAVY